MDPEIVIPNEASQTKKENIIWYNLDVDSKKEVQMNLSTKQEYS